ncbi:TPA: restriction endonuclease subunit S [Vibrio parahaemolyticus]
MTKQMNVPKLRFGEFSEKWKAIELGKLMTFKNGINASKEQYGRGVKFINVTDIIENDYITYDRVVGSVDVEGKELEKNIVEYGDILFQRSSETREDVGQANVYLDKIKFATFGGFVIRGKKVGNFDSVFMNYLLKTRKARKEVTTKSGGSTRYNVGQSTLAAVNIDLPPCVSEQQKIASFLSKVDEKVALLTEKKDKLTEYKKGVMQQLFNGKWEEQDGLLTFIPPTLRFKADDGSEFPDWDEKRLGKVFTRIRRKNKENNQNVLTISAQQGLVNQEKYFNKSVAAKDVTGYYLLENGDFAYNKSYSKGYPMGAIKRLNNYDKGVVSTLYICFGLNQGFVSDFFEHYFESGLQNRDLSKIAQEGARNHGLLNISVDEFFKDVKLLTPSHDEQLKIANFISAINQKIDLANSELEKAKEWKKGLLQQMFV